MKFIGFWAEGRWDNTRGVWVCNNDTQYSMPIPSSINYEKEKFLQNLNWVQDNLANKTRYRGFSICRLCGIINGSVEYSLENYNWPEGLQHYIIQHNIMLEQEFINFIISRSKVCHFISILKLLVFIVIKPFKIT